MSKTRPGVAKADRGAAREGRPAPIGAADLDAVIDDLATEPAGVVAGAREYADIARELAAELRRALAERAAANATAAVVGPTLLGPDVFEMAMLDAQAAGVTFRDYLREAVLAYEARTEPTAPHDPDDVEVPQPRGPTRGRATASRDSRRGRPAQPGDVSRRAAAA